MVFNGSAEISRLFRQLSRTAAITAPFAASACFLLQSATATLQSRRRAGQSAARRRAAAAGHQPDRRGNQQIVPQSRHYQLLPLAQGPDVSWLRNELP